MPNPPETSTTIIPSNTWLGRFANSRFIAWISNFPPIASLLRFITAAMMKRQLRQAGVQDTLMKRAAETDIDSTLHSIVQDVVEALGYVGAMVAVYEQGDTLPLRATYIDPRIVSMDQIRQWEQQVSELIGKKISIIDPEIARESTRAYRYHPEWQDNLSIRAAEAGAPVISADLYDLFRPVVPPSSKPIIDGIQQALGIRQVIAVPFFLQATRDGETIREMVGNLFTVKRDEITAEDQLVLASFGRQAASAIEGERRAVQIKITQALVYEMQTNLSNEAQILRRIVSGIVENMNFAGAMVATLEADGALSVRATRIDTAIASAEQIRQWEIDLSRAVGTPLSITDTQLAFDTGRVYVNNEAYRDNLGVRAVKAQKSLMSSSLYELFCPIVPASAKPLIDGIQQALGIQQMITVPFFLRLGSDENQRQLIGNLFVATRSRVFSQGEIEMLQIFGEQAAAGIRNARLYRLSEERREIAQLFAKMAFSSTAYIHDLNNHIAVARASMGMLPNYDKLDAQMKQRFLETLPRAIERLNEASQIISNLHEPWRVEPDAMVDVNQCVQEAVEKLRRRTETSTSITADLSPELPTVRTAPAMLTEALRTILKNAVEAIEEAGREQGTVHIKNCLLPEKQIIEIRIEDNGTGIMPENLTKVFEMRWSTKKAGMGFGLFWAQDYITGLGGKIYAESEWGRGTTFVLELPFEAAAANSNAKVSKTEAAS